MGQRTEARLTKSEARAEQAMVASKHPVATRAGVDMLAAGGNAVDAAVAACFAVAVVEPASSGIGGGGYLVYQVQDHAGVVNFPMRAPSAASPGMYRLTGESAVGSFGWPGVEDNANLEGPLSIAVPGAVAGLCAAHQRFGRLPLADVVAPAARTAREGFLPGWHDRYAIGLEAGKLHRHAELRRIFMPGGEVPDGPAADPVILRQPDLAVVLEAIGQRGASAFYQGDVAHAIATGIGEAGGVLTEADLAAYQPTFSEPGLEIAYRGRTIRLPPFASAGITSATTLKLIEGFDLAAMGHNSIDALHIYIACVRLAYADRFAHLADPEFVDVPWNSLTSDAYTNLRRELVGKRLDGPFDPGDPWIEEGRRPSEKLAASRPSADTGTTHLCVIDGEGNAVSLTNTVMSGFGSGVVPAGTGVVMNNGMMWFDPVPGRVNSIAPGKAPLNNMTPALVLDGSGITMAVGASGGRLITNCVTQVISNVLDFGMSPQEAVDSPRVDASTPWTSADHRIAASVLDGLEARGHLLKVVPRDALDVGFSTFASPLLIVRNQGDLRAGVDTFHSAWAAGI